MGGVFSWGLYLGFAALHVPLYALLLWGLFAGGDANRGLIVGLDVFFVVHTFLQTQP